MTIPGERKDGDVTRGELQDGTPFDAHWERRCVKCGMWLSPECVGLMHGLFGNPCYGPKLTGRRRLNMGVAQRLRDRNGKPRWNQFVYVAPTKEQVREIRAAVSP